MGLSIHYKGRLKNTSSLKSLIEEAVDMAKIENWDYFVFEEHFENNSFSELVDKEKLFGVMIVPQNCEPFCLSFLSNGKMSGILNFNSMRLVDEINEDLIYSVSTKTQYTGYDNHKKLILFLDYVNTKYLLDFECIDEGYYWETKDENLLKKTFEKYTNLIDSFSTAIEMIPTNEGETMEEYLIRMAEITTKKNENKEEDLPKLSLEEENEFKRMKLSLEHDAIFPKIENSDLPPEIESQFLDHVMNFEAMYKNAKRITVYEKIGKPDFKPAESLNDLEITEELDRIETVLHQHQIVLNLLCEYENEERLIYTFITEELFQEEVDDFTLPGMVTNFIYEEFHPNHEYDIENTCTDFIWMFLKIGNALYTDYHAKDLINHQELNTFRSLFKQFEITDYQFGTITISDETAVAYFTIDFWGKIKETDAKMEYSGNGKITFKQEYGYWYVQYLTLPI